MTAMFVTTKTVDAVNHMRAYEAAFGSCHHFAFNHDAIRNDHLILEAAEKAKPKAIFYIGACRARGNPNIETLKALRRIAPTINVCSDAADGPWHGPLKAYRLHECFGLQVSIDGAIDAPVDLATLTPVDVRAFEGRVEKDIRFGFSGSVGRWNERSEVVGALAWFGGLTIRAREGEGTYEDHARFMQRCRMILNISFTGTGHAHHVKGRVLEAGWAGCCLLESAGSPIGQWFPDDCYLTYGDPVEAAEIARTIDDTTIERTARRLSEEVRARFHPSTIYGEMLEKCG